MRQSKNLRPERLACRDAKCHAKNRKANRSERCSHTVPKAKGLVSPDALVVPEGHRRLAIAVLYFPPLCPPIGPSSFPFGLPYNRLPILSSFGLPIGAIGLGALRAGPVTSSISKSSCSSSILSRPTLLLLMARSRLLRPEEPVDSVLVGPGGMIGVAPLVPCAACERAASSFVRWSSCVSMLMLACRGGELRLGLSSPLDVRGAEVGAMEKPEFRSGDPMKSELLLRCWENMPLYRDGEDEYEGLPTLPSPVVVVLESVRRCAARKDAGESSSL